jgi:hypothetical protein
MEATGAVLQWPEHTIPQSWRSSYAFLRILPLRAGMLDSACNILYLFPPALSLCVYSGCVFGMLLTSCSRRLLQLPHSFTRTEANQDMGMQIPFAAVYGFISISEKLRKGHFTCLQ